MPVARLNRNTIDETQGSAQVQRRLGVVPDTSEQPMRNEREAAEFLGMSVYWMQRMRHIGGGPSYVKIGAAVRYRRDMLEKYIEENTCSSTSEYKNEN